MDWLAYPLYVYIVVMCPLVNRVSACSANYTVAAWWERCLVLRQHIAVLIRAALRAAGWCREFRHCPLAQGPGFSSMFLAAYSMLNAVHWIAIKRNTGSLRVPVQGLCYVAHPDLWPPPTTPTPVTEKVKSISLNNVSNSKYNSIIILCSCISARDCAILPGLVQVLSYIARNEKYLQIYDFTPVYCSHTMNWKRSTRWM